MATHYLDFERPIADLDAKLEELSKLSETQGPGAFDNEIAALRRRVAERRAQTYAHLDPWQKAQIARHPERPHLVDYVAGLIEDFVVIGHEKGHDTPTRVQHNFGSPRPEGYRKAIRLMDLAEQFNLPVLSFVDTGGAYPGIDSEERGVAEAIARATERCLTLGVPMIATITGEGMSGGAIGIAAANRVLILQHSIYAVISPEGCASILLRDRGQAEGAAKAMRITADDLIRFKIVDRVIEEPVGGAHADRAKAIARVGDVLEVELAALVPLSPDALREQRAERFYAIGR
jgi:acetyl-CoA carboxylase carboxyl transferase subunit alpha